MMKCSSARTIWLSKFKFVSTARHFSIVNMQIIPATCLSLNLKRLQGWDQDVVVHCFEVLGLKIYRVHKREHCVTKVLVNTATSRLSPRQYNWILLKLLNMAFLPRVLMLAYNNCGIISVQKQKRVCKFNMLEDIFLCCKVKQDVIWFGMQHINCLIGLRW